MAFTPCQPTVRPHALPIAWNFLLGKAQDGAQGGCRSWTSPWVVGTTVVTVGTVGTVVVVAGVVGTVVVVAGVVGFAYLRKMSGNGVSDLFI